VITDAAAQKLVAAAVAGKSLTFVTGHTNSGTNLAIELGGGILARFAVNPGSAEQISDVVITVANGTTTLHALPIKAKLTQTNDGSGNLLITYTARVGYLYNDAGYVTNSTALNDQNLQISVVLDASTSAVISSSATLVAAQ
jgi:hypothetical protein